MDTSPTLLIVDNAPKNLLLFRKIVAEHLPDCDVVTVDNPDDALKLARTRRFDGALIAFKTRGMDGIDLCRRFEDNGRLSRFPVILITSRRARSSLKARAIAAGVYDFLSHPIDEIEWVARIKVMLRVSRAEESLRVARDTKDQGAVHRTTDLEVTNVRLKNEIAARKRIDEALRHTLEEARQRSAETGALLKGARAVLESHTFKDAAGTIFSQCKSLIGAKAGYVALLSADGEENEVLFLDSGGLPCNVDPALPMPVRGLRAEAYRTGHVVYDNRFAESAWVKFLPEGHAAIANVLFAPIRAAGKVVGLLGLANKPQGFDQNDLRLAAAFGEFAAIALRNARSLELMETSEERFRSVVQTATDAIVCVDGQGKVVFWNKGSETIFGYQAGEIIGKPVGIVIPERFRQAHRRGLERYLATSESHIIGTTMELYGLRKDNTEFPMELSLATWQTGQDRFFTGIVRDVTRRKLTEEAITWKSNVDTALAEVSQALLALGSIEDISLLILHHARHLTDSKHGYVGYIDSVTGHLVVPTLTHDLWESCQVTNKRIVFEVFTGLWGWSLRHHQPILTNHPEEDPRSAGTPEGHLPVRRFLAVPALLGDTLVGQLALANSSRDYTQRDMAMLEQLAALYALAIQRVRADDALHLAQHELEERVAQRTAALRLSNIELQRQIEERRHAELELRRSQASLEKAQRVARMGSWDWNILTNELSWSNEIYRIFGISPSDFEATYDAFLAAVHPDDRAYVQQHVDDALEHNTEYNIDHRIVLPDGEVRYVHEQAETTRNADDRPVHMIGTVMDITERKRAEERMRQHQQELAHVSRLSTLGEMATAIAHELNQPLTAILGCTQSCLRLLRSNHAQPQDILDGMEEVAAQAKRSAKIIRHLRDFSRRREPHRSTIDINDVVREALNFMTLETGVSKSGIRVKLAAELPSLLGDTIEIEQVIVNLVRNGLEAMAGLPREQRELHVSTALAGHCCVEIAVSDKGTGLPEEDSDRVFEAFFSTKKEGIGIGLSLSRSIIESHGGRLWATPNPDHGVTFRFTLPVEPPTD